MGRCVQYIYIGGGGDFISLFASSFVSVSTVSFPDIRCVWTFYIIILCSVPWIWWTMAVMRSFYGWWCCDSLLLFWVGSRFVL